MKAIWNGVTIAESSETVVVEGNHYFPTSDVNMSYLTSTRKKTNCPWKGIANYYTINVDGESNKNACWIYSAPKEAAKKIEGRIAFWHGVNVIA